MLPIGGSRRDRTRDRLGIVEVGEVHAVRQHRISLARRRGRIRPVERATCVVHRTVLIVRRRRFPGYGHFMIGEPAILPDLLADRFHLQERELLLVARRRILPARFVQVAAQRVGERGHDDRAVRAVDQRRGLPQEMAQQEVCLLYTSRCV